MCLQFMGPASIRNSSLFFSSILTSGVSGTAIKVLREHLFETITEVENSRQYTDGKISTYHFHDCFNMFNAEELQIIAQVILRTFPNARFEEQCLKLLGIKKCNNNNNNNKRYAWKAVCIYTCFGQVGSLFQSFQQFGG